MTFEAKAGRMVQLEMNPGCERRPEEPDKRETRHRERHLGRIFSLALTFIDQILYVGRSLIPDSQWLDEAHRCIFVCYTLQTLCPEGKINHLQMC